MEWYRGMEAQRPTTTYEADPRHAEIVITELGLDGCKALTTLVVKTEVDEDSPALDEIGTTRYESLVARVHYFAAGRFDMQEFCGQFSTIMAKPAERIGKD